MARTQFPGISSDAFAAETDKKALDALKKVPLLPLVIQKFHELGIDRWLYCWNMQSSVRCGPRQYPTLYNTLRECCQILDMAEPELYVTNNPFPNAFAGGVDRPYMVIRSSMIDTLTDDQMYYLIGHELGHIKAGHVLYMSVAEKLLPLLDLLGRYVVGLGDAASIALVAAFYEWIRQAEVTCDRAGLLCAQQFDLAAGGILALTGGPNRLSNESSLEAFLDQSRSYQEMDLMDGIGKLMIYLVYGGMFMTHPMPIHRVRLLENWVDDGSFDRIMTGTYTKTA